ncbi:MAG TPA: fused MFS/spermidine synthase, partial [Luteitalea sp.]|nr:fused MFS/spermidine synthase [Luteitalea sp.]
IEPRLDLFQQGWWWTVALGVYIGAVLICVGAVCDVPADAAHLPDESHSAAQPPPAARDYALWLALAAVPAVLLQASTTRLTLDVAAVPFLWMLPLATYLLTFIVAFEYRNWYQRRPMTMFVVVTPFIAIPDGPAVLTVAITLLALAVVGLTMHGELAARAPAPRYLTRYFLLVSAGGVIGSALVAFGAPFAFSGVLEYPLSFVLALAVLAAIYARAIHEPVTSGTASGARLIAVSLSILAVMVGIHTAAVWRWTNEAALHASRNFFGAIRVRDRDLPSGSRYRRFDHGTTMHGAQFLDAERARRPAAYFTAESGIGRAMALVRRDGTARRIGVLGQGAGTVAAFGKPGDSITFFEIDPDVIALSTGANPLFTYVRDSEARVTIVEGDGRLALERAAPSAFDVLVMDAFSSDAVPAHLLTREAMAIYVQHLRDPHSLLIVNVTNRYLDLYDVVAVAGRTVGLEAVRLDQEASGELIEGTSWMILSRDTALLDALGPRYAPRDVRPWTDAFSNLLGVIRW